MDVNYKCFLMLISFSFLILNFSLAMENDTPRGSLRLSNPFDFDPELMSICENIHRTQARCRAFVAIIQCLNQRLQGLGENDSRIQAARKIGQLLSRQDRAHFQNPTFCQTFGIAAPLDYLHLCEIGDRMDRFSTIDIGLLREYLESAVDQQEGSLYERLFELAGINFYSPSSKSENVTAMINSLTLKDE